MARTPKSCRRRSLILQLVAHHTNSKAPISTEGMLSCGLKRRLSDTSSVYACSLPGCKRQFTRKYTLMEHTKTHTGERTHICPVPTCGKSFSTSGNLSRHKRLHGYIEPLKCPVQSCICTFPSRNNLDKHMKFHYGTDNKVCAGVR
ncbi:C2H2 type zinc finger [Phytophthora infestans]|uniref:C2H2 type zinc finger n=2 Tax=Phytophthora infestans TaxID=4787 RepID=A0A8S9TH58_PHYIN|nr:C2H2 type zinc finger [Phytophthora infestans]